jgi:hypothetical protein
MSIEASASSFDRLVAKSLYIDASIAGGTLVHWSRCEIGADGDSVHDEIAVGSHAANLALFDDRTPTFSWRMSWAALASEAEGSIAATSRTMSMRAAREAGRAAPEIPTGQSYTRSQILQADNRLRSRTGARSRRREGARPGCGARPLR